ncbi:hypothetical protein EVAR_32231_1 [Eumeta japonica]|uniref:RNA-directed DNA polymerase from mobile element jockey n=1 Tax=Eumeta variegata TaxID=151549 RepID=A0A4C1YLL1_EUMVA|nr:hypothetical protein EVAR_32231_1 [Eumeta japonica]
MTRYPPSTRYEQESLKAAAYPLSSAKRIQSIFDVLSEWLDKWRMAVNVSKTAALLLRQPTQHINSIALDWSCGGVERMRPMQAPTPHYTTWHYNANDRLETISSHETCCPSFPVRITCELMNTQVRRQSSSRDPRGQCSSRDDARVRAIGSCPHVHP